MVTCWFLVIRSRDLWWVDCEGRGYGPFDTISEATSGAICLAGTFGDPKRTSQVFVPDDDGRMAVAWQGLPDAAHPRPAGGDT
jgi:hypothetical protein